MKSLLKSCLTVLILGSSLSANALDKCGDHYAESKYKDLKWHKALSVKVDSSFQNVYGIICVGVSSDHKSISRMVYRDADRVIPATLDQMKKGIAIVEDKHVPTAASIFLRSGKYVAIKVGTPKQVDHEKQYPISIRFLRNLSVSAYANDYRELSFDTILDQEEKSVHSSVDGQKITQVEFNIDTLPVVFHDIYFTENKVQIKHVYAKSLKKVPYVL